MPHTAPASFRPLQNLPRFGTRTRNVVIVPDASKSREQLDRNVEGEIGVFAPPWLCEKSIADGLHFRRQSPGRFKMFDAPLGVMKDRPALRAICPCTGVTVHHGFIGVAGNQ